MAVSDRITSCSVPDGTPLMRRRVVLVLTAAVALVAITAGLASTPVHAQNTTGLDDPAELAAWIEAAVTDRMDAYDIPGGVVVVVAGGEVVHAAGYGYADREARIPVDVTRTRFDIGSTTKLVTATAVMQQVERGRIDLRADINDYLADVEVPATYAEPITMAHLLTHTSGLAEVLYIGWFTTDLDAVEPVGQNLARYLPERIHRPGQVHQYNNHGMGLAGHAVETVSGQSFDAYVTAEIFAPLGMERSTFGAPPAVDAHDAVGYDASTGTTMAIEPWYLHLRPAGGLWTTGADMSAFMLAHLGGGSLDGAHILADDSVTSLHQPQFQPHPAIGGIGYGFFQDPPPERHGVQHAGGWAGFGSMLHLLPDDDVGICVAFNHTEGPLAASALIEEFLDRYAPITDPALTPVTLDADTLSPFAGTYRWNRTDTHTFMRLVSLLQTPTIRVTTTDDGTLTTVSAATLPGQTRWAPTEQTGVFTALDGHNVLAFDVVDGRAVRAHVAGAQLFPMERVAWYELTGLHAGLFGAIVITAFVAIIGLPVGALVRRMRRRESTSAQRRARRLAATVGMLILGLFVGLLAMFVVDPGSMLEPATATKVLLWLPIVAVPLALWLVATTAAVWRDRAGSWTGRLYHSWFAVTFVGMLPLLYYWRLLGLHW